MENKTKWVIDPAHSEIAFKVKHLMISNVKGTFSDFETQVVTEGTDFSTAQINFSLSPASIDTGSTDRDTHLRSTDFFDVEKFSTLTFKSTNIDSAGGPNYAVPAT